MRHHQEGGILHFLNNFFYSWTREINIVLFAVPEDVKVRVLEDVDDITQSVDVIHPG